MVLLLALDKMDFNADLSAWFRVTRVLCFVSCVRLVVEMPPIGFWAPILPILPKFNPPCCP